MTWTLRLPWATPPLTLNGRMHWATKARVTAEVRAAVNVLARVARIPLLNHVHVRLHYVPRDGRRRDQDNIVATLKPCLDGLVDARVIPDDTPQHLTWSPPVIDPPDPKDPHLYLTIERTT